VTSLRSIFLLGLVALCACASPPGAVGPSISLPLRTGWFADREVLYVTTEVSEQAAAVAEGANYAPRLAAALSSTGQRGVLERVYGFPGGSQSPVFQSAPGPVGALSTDASYSPLWRMVSVTWRAGKQARELRSEEAILAAEEHGDVTLVVTPVVLNCPILSVTGLGTLQGVIPRPAQR
jgi:hypothetical protein